MSKDYRIRSYNGLRASDGDDPGRNAPRNFMRAGPTNASHLGNNGPTTKRALPFAASGHYSSDEESPYPAALRKAKAQERRAHLTAAEQREATEKSNLLFLKMGIRSGDSDDEDDDEEFEIGQVAVISPKKHIPKPVDSPKPSKTEKAAIGVVDARVVILEDELAVFKEQIAKLEVELQSLNAEKASLAAELHDSKEQLAKASKSLEERMNVEMQSVQQAAEAKTKKELLERQVAALQASGERAEAERGVLAAQNAELNDKLRDALVQLASVKEGASVEAAAAAQEIEQRETSLMTEIGHLREELAVVQSALDAANEAAKSADRRASAALMRENEAVGALSRAQDEVLKAEKSKEEAKSQVNTLENELMNLRQAAAAAQESFSAQLAGLHAQLQSNEAQMAELRVSYMQKCQQDEQKVHELTAAQAENARLLNENSALKESAVQHAVGNIGENEAFEVAMKFEKEQNIVAWAKIAALEAELTAIKAAQHNEAHAALQDSVAAQQKLDSALEDCRLVKEQLTAVQQELDAKSEEIASLRSDLAMAGQTALRAASDHSLVVLDLRQKLQQAEANCAAAQRQATLAAAAAHAYMPSIPAAASPAPALSPLSSFKAGLVERKRMGVGYHDIEACAESVYSSDAETTHRAAERGVLTPFALRMGALEPAVRGAKIMDRAAFAMRDVLLKYYTVALVLFALYFAGIHFLFFSNQLC